MTDGTVGRSEVGFGDSRYEFGKAGGPTRVCVAATASDRQTRGVGSLLVITGPPGAGKSTAARGSGRATDRSVFVEGDALFAFLANGRIDPSLVPRRDTFSVLFPMRSGR